MTRITIMYDFFFFFFFFLPLMIKITKLCFRNWQLSCSSQWQFDFFLHLGKFSVMPNYINFFIINWTVDLSIDSSLVWNSAITISQLVEVNNSLSQVNTKLLCFPHRFVKVRITMMTLYIPHDVLCWNYHKFST